MAKITYNTSPYTDDADLPHSPAVTHHCPGCEAAARERNDLRARLVAEAAEWRTEARYDKTAADIFDACADAVDRIIAETEAKK